MLQAVLWVVIMKPPSTITTIRRLSRVLAVEEPSTLMHSLNISDIVSKTAMKTERVHPRNHPPSLQ